MVRVGAASLECEVVDISAGGALLAPAAGAAQLSDGARVVVELRLGRESDATFTAEARVRARGDRFAVVFRSESADLEHAIEHALRAALIDDADHGLGSSDPPAVLVVDDDLDLRSMMVEIFRDAGFVADESRDGAEALAVLRTNPDRYAVIVLDMSMPRLDGRGFCAAKQRDPAIASIPVILATSEPPAACSDLPVARLLTKPVPIPRLLAAVESCVAIPARARKGTRQG